MSPMPSPVRDGSEPVGGHGQTWDQLSSASADVEFGRPVPETNAEALMVQADHSGAMN